MNMSSTLRPRLAALAAMAAGGAWVVAGTLHLTSPDAFDSSKVDTVEGHLMMALMTAALFLTVPVVYELARRVSTIRPAQIASIGQVALGIAVTVSNINGDDPLFFIIVAPISNLAWLAGTVWLAVRLRRDGDVPKAIAIGLPLVQVFALPLSIVGGPIVSGAYLIALGYLISVDGLVDRRLQVKAA